MAWEFGLTLVGFLRGKRFVPYMREDYLRVEEKARLQRLISAQMW